ncbi:tomoregulin-2-like [Saccostrea cucullata]|uniref:tomoregulin-2-like n=1 Tax=Saccostrea cuccullata TaxID=36930 RepID=UPI002ED49DDF
MSIIIPLLWFYFNMFINHFIRIVFFFQVMNGQGLPVTWEELSSLCTQVLMLSCDDGYVADGDERLCGTDGVTYKNFCFYAQGRCRKPDITVAHFGVCLNSTTMDINPIPSTQPPQTTTLDFIIQVFCTHATIDSCPLDLDPLCGTDGNFYRNDCFFAIAKCKDTSLQSQVLEKCSTDQLSSNTTMTSGLVVIRRKK